MKINLSMLLFLTGVSCSAQSTGSRTPQSGQFDVQGIPFQYFKEGKGDPLLVIGSATYYSKAFSKELKKRYEMIFVDSRHFIPSYLPTEKDSITLSTFVEDVEILRKNLGLGKLTLIGHSVHAQIALEYASRYPRHTKRLILLCGVPYCFSELSALSQKFWEEEADEIRKATLKSRTSGRDSLLRITPPERIFALDYDLNAPRYWVDPDYDGTDLLSGLRTDPSCAYHSANS